MSLVVAYQEQSDELGWSAVPSDALCVVAMSWRRLAALGGRLVAHNGEDYFLCFGGQKQSILWVCFLQRLGNGGGGGLGSGWLSVVVRTG